MKINEFIYKYEVLNDSPNIILVNNLIDNFTKEWYKPHKIIDTMIDNSFNSDKIIKDKRFDNAKYKLKEDKRINKLILSFLNKYFPETYKLLEFKDINNYNYNNYNKELFKKEYDEFYKFIINYIKKMKDLYFDIIRLHLINTCQIITSLFKQDCTVNNIDSVTLYTFSFAYDSFAKMFDLQEPLILKLIPQWIIHVKNSPSIQILLIQLKKIFKKILRLKSKRNGPYRRYENISRRLPYFLKNYMAIIPITTIKSNNKDYLMLFSNPRINYIFDSNKNIYILSYLYHNTQKELLPIAYEGNIDKFLTEINYYYSNIKNHEITKLIKFYSYNFNNNELKIFVDFSMN